MTYAEGHHQMYVRRHARLINPPPVVEQLIPFVSIITRLCSCPSSIISLFVDLHRTVVNMTLDEAKAHAVCADGITAAVGGLIRHHLWFI
jgi:hypothetical protein